MSKQTKLTKAARGRDCQVRLPGCPNNTETTVLAHYRLAGTCGQLPLIANNRATRRPQ